MYLTLDYGPSAADVTFICSPNGSCAFATGDLNVVIQKSTDYGRTWGPIIHVSRGFLASGGDSAPLLLEHGGDIAIAYQGYDRWSTPIRVTPDTDNATHIVEVAGGKPGIAYVAWLADNAAGEYAEYLRPFSLRHGWLSGPVMVSRRAAPPITSVLSAPTAWPTLGRDGPGAAGYARAVARRSSGFFTGMGSIGPGAVSAAKWPGRVTTADHWQPVPARPALKRIYDDKA